MTTNLKTFLVAFVVTASLIQQIAGYAVRRDDAADNEIEANPAVIVVEAVRELLQDLQEGITAKNLKDSVDGIIVAVDGVLADADADVDEAEAEEVISTLLETIYDKDDQDDSVKVNVAELNRQFTLLGGLADAVESLLETSETEGLYETLLAIKITAATLLDTVDDIGNGIAYKFVPGPSAAAGDNGDDDTVVDDDDTAAEDDVVDDDDNDAAGEGGAGDVAPGDDGGASDDNGETTESTVILQTTESTVTVSPETA